LTAAHSIPDMMTAWQFWAARRAEMMAEDRTHLLTTYQTFADTLCARCVEGLATRRDWQDCDLMVAVTDNDGQHASPQVGQADIRAGYRERKKWKAQ
jgi:hypothetical protein